MAKLVSLVIPSLCESPVSVAAESANAVGAGVGGGSVVVVVGATVVVVVGATVVVGARVVVGATEATTGIGGMYPHPDNWITRTILIVEITFTPLFTRS
jgi:hypothetical protein